MPPAPLRQWRWLPNARPCATDNMRASAFRSLALSIGTGDAFAPGPGPLDSNVHQPGTSMHACHRCGTHRSGGSTPGQARPFRVGFGLWIGPWQRHAADDFWEEVLPWIASDGSVYLYFTYQRYFEVSGVPILMQTWNRLRACWRDPCRWGLGRCMGCTTAQFMPYRPRLVPRVECLYGDCKSFAGASWSCLVFSSGGLHSYKRQKLFLPL